MDLADIVHHVADALRRHDHFADVKVDPNAGTVSALVDGNQHSALVSVNVATNADHTDHADVPRRDNADDSAGAGSAPAD